MNLGRIKVLIFYTFVQFRTKCNLMLSNRRVEVVGSYVYLGITFTARAGKFSMTQATKDRLTKGSLYNVVTLPYIGQCDVLVTPP